MFTFSANLSISVVDFNHASPTFSYLATNFN